MNPPKITEENFAKLENFLTHFPNHFLQSFDDQKNKKGELAKIFQYKQTEVSALQANGAGIYLTLNPTQDGRRIDQLTAITALGLDLDVAKEKEQQITEQITKAKKELRAKLNSFERVPHFIIETKNGLQPIWLFEKFQDYASPQAANEIYKSVVAGICQQIGHASEGDSVIRVVRLPFTFHLKTPAAPFQIRILVDNSALPRLDFDEFVKKFSADKKQSPQNSSPVSPFLKDVSLEEVILKAAREAGVEITFSEQPNGTKQIIENGESTSGFISQSGEFCCSMSGNARKGGQIGVVKYYLNLSVEEAKKWLKRNFGESKFTPDELARLIVEQKNIAFLSKKYFQFDQKIWREIKEEEINHAIIETMENLKQKHSRNTIRAVREYLNDFAYQKYGAELEKRLLEAKRSKDEAALLNGVFHADKKTLRPFEREDFFTSLIEFDFAARQPNCPRWLQFLDEIFAPDSDREQKKRFIQEWFGLSLVPDNSHEKALILLGDGSNGKSILLYIWQQLLGSQNYSAIDLGDIVREQYTAKLLGKLLNIASDIQSENQLDTGIFKKLVSGEVITGKEVYQKPITFANTARLVFATNTLPFLKEAGNAVRRRVQILKFNECFTEENKDRNLKNKLKVELPEIFLWSVEGLCRLKKRGYFLEPPSVSREIEEYLRNNDSLQLFLQDCCEITKDESDRVQKSVFYRDYKNYCRENGILAKSARRVHPKLRQLGVDERKINGERWLVGVSTNYLSMEEKYF